MTFKGNKVKHNFFYHHSFLSGRVVAETNGEVSSRVDALVVGPGVQL